MHDYPESECCELAKELIEFEEMNIEELKYYLSKRADIDMRIVTVV